MARRSLIIAEEFGAYYITNGDGLRVQSASLDGALLKAAIKTGVVRDGEGLGIRSAHDASSVLESLMGGAIVESGFGAA